MARKKVYKCDFGHVEPCVYTITCLKTGDFYVGSCWRPYRRFHEHMWALAKGRHRNKILQNAYDKYGKDWFEYTVIRHFHPKEISRYGLFACEQMYIDYMKPQYNILRNVGGYSERKPLTPGNTRKWIVSDPNGNTYEIENLRKFCREHDLCRPNMWYVAQGRMSHYKGWKCSYADGSSPVFRNHNPRTYELTFPDGRVEQVTNLSKYCRDNKLPVSYMLTVACGGRTSCRGIKVVRIDK
jgi:hypothetical protein